MKNEEIRRRTQIAVTVISRGDSKERRIRMRSMEKKAGK
jgi:hypothetical protein